MMTTISERQSGLVIAGQCGVLAAAFFLEYLFAFIKVKGDSMVPTIAKESTVYYEKISCQFNLLKTDDIVIFTPPIDFYRKDVSVSSVRLAVKRIMAMSVRIPPVLFVLIFCYILINKNTFFIYQ